MLPFRLLARRYAALHLDVARPVRSLSSVLFLRSESSLVFAQHTAALTAPLFWQRPGRALHTAPRTSTGKFEAAGQRDSAAAEEQRPRASPLQSSLNIPPDGSLPQRKKAQIEMQAGAAASNSETSASDATSTTAAAPSAEPSQPRPRSPSPPQDSAFERLAALALTVLQIVEKLETLVLAAQLAFYAVLAGAAAYIAWKLYKQHAELEAWWQAKKDGWAARKARFWKPLGDASDAAHKAAADARAAIAEGAEAAQHRASSARAAIEEHAAAAREAVSQGSGSAQEAAAETWAAAVARVKSFRAAAASSDAAAPAATSSAAGATSSAPAATSSAPAATLSAAGVAQLPEAGQPTLSAARSEQGEPLPAPLDSAPAPQAAAAPALADSPLTARLRRLLPSRSSSGGTA